MTVTRPKDVTLEAGATPALSGRAPRAGDGSSSARSSKVGTGTGEAPSALPKRICIFRLGPTLYACDVRLVRRIVGLDGVIPVPGAPPSVLGLQMVHGGAVAVVNIPSVLSLPETGEFMRKPTTALVLDLGGELEIAASIDRVESVANLRKEDFRARTSDAEPPAVFGMVELGDDRGGVTLLSSDVLVDRVQAIRFRSS